MKCNEVRGLLSEHMDGELSAGVKESVKLHLIKCRGCSEVFKQLKADAEGLKTLPGLEVPESFYSGLDRKLAASEAPLFSRFAGLLLPRNLAVLGSGMLAGVIIGALVVANISGKPRMDTAKTEANNFSNKIVISTKDINAANDKIEQIRRKYGQANVQSAGLQNQEQLRQNQQNQITPKKYIVVLDEGSYNSFFNDLNKVGAVQNQVPFGKNTVFMNSANVKQTRIELELEEDFITSGGTNEGGKNNGQPK